MTPENLKKSTPAQAMPEVDIAQTIKKSRGEDDSGKQMDTLQILRGAVEGQLPTGMNFDLFLRKLATILKDQNNKLVQMGNTIFLVKRITPEHIEFHTFSSEGTKALIRNFNGLIKLAKNQGFKKISSYADEPMYVELAKKTGLPVKIGQSQRVEGNVAKPVYTFEMEL